MWNEAMWDAVAKIVFSHNSPSKIEGAGGSMNFFLNSAKQISFESLSYSPFIPLYLRGGIDTQLFNYSNHYNRNLNY